MALFTSMGLVGGLGSGINTGLALTTAVEWTEKYVGLATSLFIVSQACGSIMSNYMVTAFINPDNLRPDANVDHVAYFSQAELLDRVPKYFLTYGTVSFVISTFGILFMRTKDGHSKTTGYDVNKGSPQKSSTDSDEFGYDKTAESNELPTDNSKFGNVYCGPTQMTDVRRMSFAGSEFGNVDLRVKQRIESRRMSVASSEFGNVDHRAMQFAESNDQDDSITSTFSNKLRGESSKEPSNNKDMTPIAAVKQYRFYVITLAIILSDCTFCIIPNYYKTFGLTYIPDDHFMSTIATLVVVSIALCSCVSGIISDQLNLNMSLGISTLLLIFLSAFYFFTPTISRILFAAITIIVPGLVFFNYNIYRVVILKHFGSTHFSDIYGMALVISASLNVLWAPLISFLLDNFEWLAIFIFSSLLNAVTLLCVLIGFPRH